MKNYNCFTGCGFTATGPSPLHKHYVENVEHRPPYWDKRHGLEKALGHKESQWTPEMGVLVPDRKLKRRGRKPKAKAVKHLSVVGSKVNGTEDKVEVGRADRGMGHYSYAVLKDGEVWIECGTDMSKAQTIVEALNKN